MITFYKRFKALSHVTLKNDKANICFDKSVDILCENNSKIIIHGRVVIGYPLPNTTHFPTYNKTIIKLSENATLIFSEDAFIAPGCTIRIGKNGIVTFGGDNQIAHNCTFICTKEITIGKHTSISWCCNFIDDDGHRFFHSNGTKIERINKPLLIGHFVGIHMNVIIPRGVTIGNNSIIGAGTTVREDIPDNVLAYNETKLKIKEHITSGLQFNQQ